MSAVRHALLPGPLRSVLAAAFLLPWPWLAHAAEIDPAASHFGFQLSTRWGQALEGRFARAQGRIVQLADGRQQVRLSLAASSVEIVGNPTYTRYTRGEGFFDAQRHPRVEFVSDPFNPGLLREGGQMSGQLSIRDVVRNEVLQVAPTRCDVPGVACAVVVHGDVRREDYGMQRWRVAIASRVRLHMQVRLLEPVQ